MKYSKSKDNLLNIESVRYFLSEIKLKVLIYFDIGIDYFDIRYLYGPEDRYILDCEFIKTYEDNQIGKYGKKSLLTALRYKHLKHKYRSKNPDTYKK